jgi:ADP-ribose pyrophosphatase YjhB (NUDIX family)
MNTNQQQLLSLIEEIRAIGQTGLAYNNNEYDIARFKRLIEIAAEIGSNHIDLTKDQLLKIFMEDRGYTTPKVAIRGAVFKDGKILMVRETIDNKWSLPGGWADIGDSPSEVCEREILEESGFVAKAIKLIALQDLSRHPHPPSAFYTYKCFFLCELIGGEVKTSIETSEVSFFASDNIPELSLPRTLHEQIEMCFRHYYNPKLPTEFD